MGARQRLATTAQGRAVLVKQADAGEDADRLAREAALLRASRHPGVVEVLDELELAGGGREVSLAVAGSRTLTDLRTDLAGAAGLMAALATTVADLHELGVVHGRLTADHVVVDAGGRPVLCGFAGAGRIGSQPPGAPAPLEPGGDVAALGALLSGLVSPDGGPLGDWEPIPERRLGRRDRWTGFARRSLLTLADQAGADDPARRPTARALAASVLAALPTARLPATVEEHASTPEADGDVPAEGGDLRRRPARQTGRWRRAVAPLAAGAGLGLVVFGAFGLLRPAAGPARVPAGPRPEQAIPAAPSAGADAPSPSEAPAAGGERPLGCPLVPPPAADPDGDGCASPVAVAGGVVEVDGVRYGVGLPGDLLAVGDWDCDGAATVALVRRDRGEVFVFDGWASVGADAVATIAATVSGAVAVAADDPDGDGCGPLVVTDNTGRRTEVPA